MISANWRVDRTDFFGAPYEKVSKNTNCDYLGKGIKGQLHIFVNLLILELQ